MLWRICAFAALGGFLFGCAVDWCCCAGIVLHGHNALCGVEAPCLAHVRSGRLISQAVVMLALDHHTAVESQGIACNGRYDLGVMGGALLGISDELAISEWAQASWFDEPRAVNEHAHASQAQSWTQQLYAEPYIRGHRASLSARQSWALALVPFWVAP